MRPFASVALLAAVTVVCPSWPYARAQEDAAAMIARIEAPQPPDRELTALTLQEVMQRLRVPGLSIAVIKDFRIHWTKGYGVTDVETGRPVRVTRCFRPRRSANRW